MKPLQLFGWCWMIAALTVLLPLPAKAEPVQQIIAMRAADGRVVPALVTYPEGGPESGSPVAIIVHGGPGGHPLRALGAARWAATYFADHGYITISVLTRISRDVIDQPFGAAVADIKGAVDWASQLSDGPIVLIGHSSGSVTSSMYMATTNDPRVKAIVHFAPTAWGSGWMIRSMGQARYAAVVARLNKLVAQGRGDEPVYEDHQLAPPAPQTVTYGYLMNARTWLSWWGPNSKNRNIALFPKIRVPMLMISGDRDIFVSRAYQEELRLAATASPRVDSIILDGGIPHEFTGAEVKASTLAYDWLTGIGIGPQLRIETRVVDLKIGSDIRPGVIYQPVDPARRKPLAVILMADFARSVCKEAGLLRGVPRRGPLECGQAIGDAVLHAGEFLLHGSEFTLEHPTSPLRVRTGNRSTKPRSHAAVSPGRPVAPAWHLRRAFPGPFRAAGSCVARPD